MAASRRGDEPERGIAALGERYELTAEAESKLSRLLGWLLSPQASTSIRTPQAAIDDHLADSLVALGLEAMREARAVLDLGPGAGLPGLPLAIAMPSSAFTLLESATRKVGFLQRVVADCQIANVDVVHSRAESFSDGEAKYDVITARAVAPLPVVFEYAAPLLRIDGTLIVWRGRREPDVERSAWQAAEQLGLGVPKLEPVKPYPGAAHRHLCVVTKVHDTPSRFPRRPGVALKRPLG